MALCKDVQDAVVAYLQAQADFAGVEIIGRRKANIVSDIAAAVGRLGVCIYVFPALPVVVNRNDPGPYIDRLSIRCRAIEHPTLNTSGPDCYELVELLLRYLTGKHLTTVEGLQPLWFDAGAVQIVDDAEQLVQHDVVALSSCGLTPRA
jgi:hypothetical protein